LHRGAMKSLASIMRYLLENGAHPSLQDDDGWSPLHCSASKNSMICAKLLIDSGADASLAARDGRMAAEVATDEKLRTYLAESASAFAQSQALSSPVAAEERNSSAHANSPGHQNHSATKDGSPARRSLLQSNTLPKDDLLAHLRLSQQENALLREEVSLLKEERRQYVGERDRMMKERDELQSRESMMSDLISSRKDELDVIRQRLDGLRSENEKLRSTLKETNNLRVKLEQEAELLRENSSRMSNIENEQEAVQAKLTREVKNLSKSLTALQSEADGSRQELKEKRQALQSMSSRLEDISSERNDLLAQIQALLLERERARRDVKRLQGEALEVRTQNAQLQGNSLDSLSVAALDELSRSALKAIERIAVARSVKLKNMHDAEVEEMKKRLAGTAERERALQAAIRDKESHLQNLQSEMNERESEIKGLLQERNMLRGEGLTQLSAAELDNLEQIYYDNLRRVSSAKQDIVRMTFELQSRDLAKENALLRASVSGTSTNRSSSALSD
jgi:hypothetical protein